MNVRPIVLIPNTVLIEPAKTITAFDERLKTTITDMTSTLKAAKNPKGVGLAAPQVGLGIRLFLTRPTEKSAIRAFINPEIIAQEVSTQNENEDDDQLEGCLSIPKVWGHVKRSSSLTLRYQDETGAVHEEKFDGFMATIIQHETDHVNGILFTRRVVEQNGRLYQSVYDKKGRESLEEIRL